MKKYKVGIIGLGRMGSLFDSDKNIDKPASHTGAYLQSNRIESIVGCDIRRDRLDTYKKTWGIDKLYFDYKEMLQKEDLDIISICTHPNTHREICVDAAKSGVKGIFCEKPISLTLKEADIMINTCKDNKVSLTVDYTRRWDDSFNKAKQIIDSGVLGKITTVTGFCSAGFSNGGTHLFDLIRYFFGDIDRVSGTIVYDKSIDPQGTCILVSKNKVKFFVDSMYRNYILFGLNIYGKDKMMDTMGMIRGEKQLNVYSYEKNKAENGVNILSLENSYKFPFKPPLVNAINDIINSIERRKSTRCNGIDGYKALEIAIAVHLSNSKIMDLPLKCEDLGLLSRPTSFTEDGEL